MTENPALPTDLTYETVSRLRRQASNTIEGRASFEKHVGRKSTKPLPPVEVDAHTLLVLLDRAYPEASPR